MGPQSWIPGSGSSMDQVSNGTRRYEGGSRPQEAHTGNETRNDDDDTGYDNARCGGVNKAKAAAVSSTTAPAGPTDGGSLNREAQVLIFYSSITTNTGRIANEFKANLDAAIKALPDLPDSKFLDAEVLDLAEIDFDDYFIAPPASKKGVDLFYMILLPSYNIDTINDTFLEHLKETHYDFRIDTGSLSALLGYSVFGFGDREGWPDENEGYCFQAKEVDKWMARLTGRKRAYPVGMGDIKIDYRERMAEWTSGVTEILGQVARTGNLGEGLPGSGSAVESDDESGSDVDEEYDDGETLVDSGSGSASGDLGDVEDLGKIVEGIPKEAKEAAAAEAPLAVDFTNYGKSVVPLRKRAAAQAVPKEMVPKNSPTYASLTKQGYAIVGSHSGVKICRWTKSALRGRGSCYKYSFYGINSHQCMESTPSLSCSNKCVFCWRHGTNPVGTTWRWVVDPPDLIFNGIKANHYQKIKVLRGMAGVRAERYAEAMRIRHCALSLVGEPIFYPHINEFLALLHGDRISSFLVCNAQHPDQLAALKAVTQLYVSIDASNKESLRRIDRPLHRDFWERFQRCLDILREKRFKHRTVFRLTLVKGFNIDDEVEGYADLVERGLPCFVEIKGFVRALERRLGERGLGYGIAAEHAHSCCVLIASDRFRVDGKWHTKIDYERFFQLLEERGADGDWTPEEYMGEETPEWATWGNGGFDPRDERVDRKGRKIEI
ncbi:unnamed protein product [Parascedosporium putredinis]|uniref:tRNA 4-demethylwyosine synthase (AdoMet-dependent) n=1 Tax=Parascedosporium putredinis TaxID=1442378 RepID=A0A9P1MB41_9PEZI|nr:unnamed protein product [Parascedosporium putredinis]CAI7998819.1 unnamed protein product [Parascedosporium putredinis]